MDKLSNDYYTFWLRSKAAKDFEMDFDSESSDFADDESTPDLIITTIDYNEPPTLIIEEIYRPTFQVGKKGIKVDQGGLV